MLTTTQQFPLTIVITVLKTGAEDEVLSVVNNIRKPLALGYTIVKNRSQAELKSATTLQQAVQNEENYFATHDVWQQINSEQRGINALCTKLTAIIVKRAQERAPYIKYNLTRLQQQAEEQLVSLGGAIPDDDNEKRKVLINIISTFNNALRQISTGDYRDSLTQNHKQLRIKYFISQLLADLKVSLASVTPDFDSVEYEQRLSTCIIEMRGRLVTLVVALRLCGVVIVVGGDDYRCCGCDCCWCCHSAELFIISCQVLCALFN